MELAYKKAFTDVLYLTKQIDDRLTNKISDSFITFMKENCDAEYKPKNISISNPDSLSQETKTVLSLIYRCYLTDDKKDCKNIIEDNVVLDTKEEQIIPDEKSMVVPSKSNNIFRKIHNFIQRIFKHGGKE